MSNTFNYNVNATSGILRKSHPKSKMVTRKLSNNPYEFSPNNPRVYVASEGVYRSIVVLQVMACGDDRVLIEYVETKDFEAEG